MKRFLPTSALLALAMLGPVVAQEAPPGSDGTPANTNGENGDQAQNGQRRQLPFALWKAELPGGSYLVARNAISSVSLQEYILDGVARVTEVNVTTGGNFHPRFYFLEMIDLNAPVSVPGADLAAEAVQTAVKETVEQTAPELASKVVKNYPATTHASTVEFRLGSAAQIKKLYESVERVWLTGESEVYTPGGVRRLDPNKEIKNANDDSGDGGPGSTGSGTN